MRYSSIVFSIGLSLISTILVVDRHSGVSSAGMAANTTFRQLPPDCSSAKGLTRVVCLADAFKATLTTDQLAVLQLPYSKTDAVKWSNLPQAFSRLKRVGLSFGSLNATQLKAAKALMAAVMATDVPNEGLDEFEGGLAADDYFGATTGKSDIFGIKNYFIAFLGTPSTTARWELQYGGHHYAFANTYNDGKLAGVTPAFRGVEPMTPVTANGRTYQPLEQERLAFATLLGSLSSTEQHTARLSTTLSDVLLGPGKDGQFPSTKQGLKVGDLPAARQTLVLNAIKLYVNDLDPATAAAILERYTAELADTYLAYTGSGTMSQPTDYIRLDGPGIWLEFSGQPSRDFPGTIHPHSVWRDHRSDYGGQ